MKRYHVAVYYEMGIVGLALLSIALVICDVIGAVNLYEAPYSIIDDGITAIFAVDYVARLYKSPSKMRFFKSHIFDLLAIIPFNYLFSVFRISRLTRLARLGKVARLAGVTARLKKYFQRMLTSNGVLYILYLNLALVFVCSAIVAYVEQRSFVDAIWWSIATITTVGYGDVVPVTLEGKAVAIVLMLSGIGTLGLLTSSLTNLLVESENETEKQLHQIEKELADQRALLLDIQKSLHHIEEKLAIPHEYQDQTRE